MSVTAIRLEMDTEQMQKIFGMQDAYIKKLEQDFQVTIVDRNGSVMITGEEENVSKASRVLRQLPHCRITAMRSKNRAWIMPLKWEKKTRRKN